MKPKKYPEARIFGHKDRILFGVGQPQRECWKCGTWYPRNRKKCPACARARRAAALLDKAKPVGVEIRDGQEFTVVRLPEKRKKR